MKKAIIITSLALLFSGCATALTTQGALVHLVDSQSRHNCRFIASVTGSNSMGGSTAHDAEGAMNEVRNRAAEYGANAVRIIDVTSTAEVTTVIGEALLCQL